MDEAPRSRTRRREFLGTGAAAVAVGAIGLSGWRVLLAGDDETGAARAAVPRGGGYGPLADPDENGIRLPAGFRSRILARGGETVPGTGYRWHEWSDGAATFALGSGGWIMVANSETAEGGASAIRFSADGEVADAYRILEGTSFNCGGGPTPWGTWLSCEEIPVGRVWECDPRGRRPAVVHPAMGVFKHEAAAVDPVGRRVYMTEDLADGRFYRFTPSRWRDLSRGRLEVATVSRGGRVRWDEVPDPAGVRVPTRRQVRGSTRFRRAEGIWYDRGTIFVTTTYDTSIRAYDPARERMSVIYDGLASADAPLLRVDQITASPSGEVFVCEDISLSEIPMGVLGAGGRMTRFLSVTGSAHENSELTGVAFAPDGRRMYFASQRANEVGAVYEVTGPFRTRT